MCRLPSSTEKLRNLHCGCWHSPPPHHHHHRLIEKWVPLQHSLFAHCSVSVTEINISTIWTKPIPAHAPCFIGRFLELWIIELRLEHQMAEESFDSGVSSEHSQYTIEHKSCPDTVQKHNDLCADIWSPTSCGHNGEGYYGPKPAPYYSHIHSDSSLDHVKRSCLKRNYRQRSKPLLRSDQLASDTEPVGSVHSNPVQFIRRKAKAPGAQIQVFSDLASIKTMSSNPRDYPNGSIGPQRSSVYPEIAGSRGMESRVVHFAREQRDVGEKAVCERSLLPDITLDERIRLTDSRSRTSLPEYSRPPLIRNYSARDYVYLPSLQQNQMASSVPVLSRQQTLRSLLANQLDEHSEVLPSEPSIENRPRDSTYSAHVQVQPTSEVASGRTVLDRITSDMSSVTLGTDQERQQLLSALLSASKPTTSSSSQTSVLQSLLQRVNPQSGVGTSRPPVSARWSDSDMTMISDGHRQQNLRMQKQQQQQRLLQQQRQQQAAAAAAAAAAAVAIATMQCTPRSTIGVVSPTNRAAQTAQQPVRRIPTRSCYSSGDEEMQAPGASVLSELVNQFVQYREGLPGGAKHTGATCQNTSLFTRAPTQAGQTSSSMPGQAFAQGQMKIQASGSAEDYANYQSLDAILGQMHAQPPPPAPCQPMDFRPLTDIYQVKSTVPDESYSVHSTTGIPAAHSLPGLPPLQIDPMINVECRLPDVPTEARPEDRFRDFLLLPSERCVTTTYAQSADCAPQPLHDWSYPDQSPHGTHPKSNNLNGLLVVHLVAGNGLSSSQIMLRDLYCVVEMDSIRKARSMIRTSSSFFEWNEVFELDMEESRFLAFLLYQWDPRTKHRLCFYGGIDLRNLIGRLISLSKKSTSFGTPGPNQTGQKRYQQILLSPALTLLPSNFEKIALQLEPRGVLYLEFGYYPLERIYHRYQPTVSTSLHHASISDDVLFGVTIDELMERERNIVQLTSGLGRAPTASRFVNDSLYIPLFIRKCVEEIDRRGTEVVGIYRLAGSVWMKLQVRELFNQVTRSTLRAVFQGDRKALEGITGLIDLSPARVPDIHAITALFKDFLRELPEPLFTSALYPMFYDAMQVTLPDFSQSGAKLMLNILDCLPTNNQEILLYLLDHFKRITNQSEINRMNTHNLANCLAPVLFYPAPNSARNMDPAILEPRKMAEIFQFILEIWPDERKPPTCTASGVHSWPPVPYHFAGQEETLSRHPMYRSHRHKQVPPHYRASSTVRSTLSGPAAPGIEDHSSQFDHRSSNVAASERSGFMGMGRTGRMKFTSVSVPVQHRSEDVADSARRTQFDHYPPPSQTGRALMQTHNTTTPRRTRETEAAMFENMPEEQALKARHPHFHDIPTTGSTDSGTRSSLSTGGRHGASTSRQAPLIKRSTRPDSARSFSQERKVYSHSPRSSRRSQPYT